MSQSYQFKIGDYAFPKNLKSEWAKGVLTMAKPYRILRITDHRDKSQIISIVCDNGITEVFWADDFVPVLEEDI